MISRIFRSLLCILCFSSALYAEEKLTLETLTFKPYNLVPGLPDILISSQAEKLGRTWSNGIVWDKSLINKFYELLCKKKEPIVVLDVGAQTGCFTLLSKYCPHSRWYAFEPIQEAVEILQSQLKANGIQNASVYQFAVSNKVGFATLKLPSDCHWGLATLGDNPHRFMKYETRIVESIDLDTFVSHQKIEKVDFIKIDVEGWEYFVLQGGKTVIARDKPTILMEFNRENMHQCQVDPNQVKNFLKELGYKWEPISDDILCTPKTR